MHNDRKTQVFDKGYYRELVGLAIFRFTLEAAIAAM